MLEDKAYPGSSGLLNPAGAVRYLAIDEHQCKREWAVPLKMYATGDEPILPLLYIAVGSSLINYIEEILVIWFTKLPE